MDLESLNSLVRRVRTLAPERRILVFGSSSLFASFPSVPPSRIGVELTLDADFFLDPDDELLRTRLLAQLGRNRAYHAETGYYGDFVDLRLADSFPAGWRERLVPMPGFDNVFALDPVDMAVTKITATASARLSIRFARGGIDRGMKDISVIVALLNNGRLAREAIERRLGSLDCEPALLVECWQIFATITQMVSQA